MQKLILSGNLGQDPEMRYTPDGTAVTNVSLACNRQWKNADGEKVKETTWFRLSFWGKRAETANQYFQKGMPLIVEGRLRAEPNVFERKDGTWGTSYEVTVENFHFVSGSDTGESQRSEEESESKDIPF